MEGNARKIREKRINIAKMILRLSELGLLINLYRGDDINGDEHIFSKKQ